MQFMTHIVAGYPTKKTSLKIAEEMTKFGISFIEIQIPFSDPIADGPVIMQANQKALENKTTPKDCLDLMKELKKKPSETELLFMCYFNTIFNYGIENFCRDAKKAGAYGLIVPDIPPEEGKDYLTACKKYKLHPIFVLAPTSTKKRIKKITKKASGFIYLMARTGTTGQKTKLGKQIQIYIQNIRKYTKLPLAVGFGIKEKEQIKFLENKADIAVIGSGILEEIRESKEKEAVEKVKKFLGRIV